MPVEDVLDDCKAKAGAAARPAFLDADPVEALGQARNMLFGDARPMVAHRQLTNPSLGFAAIFDGLAGLAYLMAFSTRFWHHLHQFVPIARTRALDPD